jgi:long-chain-fatty-acid--[acyl-carrier-protein] ligase
VITGAEKCPEALAASLATRWPRLEVLEGYGITECSPVVCGNIQGAARIGTIGVPLPSVTCALVDLDTGRRVAPGGTGMLLVRGPSIFGGYLGSEESPFTDFEGLSWYRTGDLVREDPEGRLVFAGRLKRFVKLGGEMISLPAIEEVLVLRFTRPGDEEPVVAVEAMPAEANPDLVLFTVRPVTREEANGALRAAGLGALHAIRQVRLVERIPLLGTGKTDYRALKALLAESGREVSGAGA